MDEITIRLRVLGICYYVLAVALVAPLLIIPLIIMLSASADDPFVTYFLILFIFTLIPALGLVAVGYGFRKQRWWVYCFSASTLLCLCFPIGTALGIFSIITLIKPEAKELFSPNQHVDLTPDGAGHTER